MLPTFLREGRTTTRAPDRLRRGHRPADRPAAPGRARALACARGPRQAGTGPARPDGQLQAAREGLEARPARRRPRRSTTRARSSAGWTPSCASSRRSSTISASTSARSRPSSPTPRPRRRPRRATARATCAPRTRSTRRSWPPIRTGSPPTARTPTRLRAAQRARHLPEDVRELPVHLEPGARARRRPTRPRQSLVDVLDYYAWGGTKNRGAAPPCTAQSPLGPQTNGGAGLFPRLQPLAVAAARPRRR